ncbi:phage tail protein [Pseudomonas putida]|uniref:phage tail tube protein n=1 Tax=Pseudomonas putida TaxID=303 RepID=UPI0018E67FDA|nr:phage tail protein [Pseudomonas putida]MBI6960539.1 phage tail protein [Pseudomonas putida]
MSILSQGTQIYALVPTAGNPSIFEVMEIECATAFSPGGNPADQIETTCLSETVRSYMRGLRTPGQATLSLNADPRNASHVRLHQLSEDDSIESIRWVVGWSDGKGIAPTVGSSGALAAISLTDGGSGYTSAPTVAITGGGGTGAAATAIVSGGEVTGFNITNPGSGYTSAPTIALTGGGGSDAAASAVLGAGDDFVLPPTRTWFLFDGYVSDFPFDFAANAVVTTAATIQRSGGSAWIRKTA